MEELSDAKTKIAHMESKVGIKLHFKLVYRHSSSLTLSKEFLSFFVWKAIAKFTE